MESMETDLGHYIKRSYVDVLEAEREEETKMVNEKECFRLFGVDLSTKIREEEEARKKMKNDGSFGKTPETSPHPKMKVIQWSREEHKRFLIGLKEKGRGNWNEIATKYVKTRTKSQVASHAQKYFLHVRGRHQNKNRFSVFSMPSEPAVPCQAFTSFSSSSSSPHGEEASTSRQLPVPMNGKFESNHPCNSHAGPYMAGKLPQNMVGFQSFATKRFPSAVIICVPMVILPGPPMSNLRSSHREFAAAVTNKHPNQ